MKVNFNRKFRSYDGRELAGQNIASAVAEALFNYGKDKPVSREDKFKAYVLASVSSKTMEHWTLPRRKPRLLRKYVANA